MSTQWQLLYMHALEHAEQLAAQREEHNRQLVGYMSGALTLHSSDPESSRTTEFAHTHRLVSFLLVLITHMHFLHH